jgi:uncharacterized protein YjbJ (UPF0337 family)
MNKDQVKGRIEEVKGEIKKAAGKAVAIKDLENRGVVQKAAGQVQAGYGDLKKDISKK